MPEISYVVVFPSIFAKNKIPVLISNIRKILRIKNQRFQSIKKDDDIILVEANDPVFASSAINLLFGVSKVAIARKIENKFDTIVSEITNVGGNLLLRGERFLVRVDGETSGFLTKDVEIAATSSIIEKKSDLEVRPGTDENYDKLLYTFLTKSNAYVCVYLDEGRGGSPTDTQKSKVLCCIYDEISAVSCLEMIKQGFPVEILVCYNKKPDLMNLVKILVRLIPLTLKDSLSVEFFRLDTDYKRAFNHFVDSALLLLINRAKKNKFLYISIPINPMVFGEGFLIYSIKEATKNKLIVYDSLGTLDVAQDAKRLGIENFEFLLEKASKRKSSEKTSKYTSDIAKSLPNLEKITIIPGPNNLHEILDSLGVEH